MNAKKCGLVSAYSIVRICGVAVGTSHRPNSRGTQVVETTPDPCCHGGLDRGAWGRTRYARTHTLGWEDGWHPATPLAPLRRARQECTSDCALMMHSTTGEGALTQQVPGLPHSWALQQTAELAAWLEMCGQPAPSHQPQSSNPGRKKRRLAPGLDTCVSCCAVPGTVKPTSTACNHAALASAAHRASRQIRAVWITLQTDASYHKCDCRLVHIANKVAALAPWPPSLPPPGENFCPDCD